MAAKPVDEAEAIRVYEKDIRILEETVNTGKQLADMELKRLSSR